MVLASALILSAICYLDRVCISTASPAIMEELDLKEWQMGYVFSVFTLAYALFEVPSGWLMDRFGPRRMLTRIVFWWSVMTSVTGAAAGFKSLLFLRGLFGLGEAGMFPGCARVFARWLPSREHGRAFGLVLMTAALGGALTPPLVVYLLDRVTWHWVFAIFGTVGVVWAVVWAIWFRDDPHDHKGVNEEELEVIGTNPPVPHEKVPWWGIARNRNLFAICIMYFTSIYGWYFYITWLPKYLLTVRGFDMKGMGWFSALPLLGIALGVAFGGWLSDVLTRRYGSRLGRRLPGLVGLPLAAMGVVAAVWTTSPHEAAWLMAAAAGWAAMGVSPAWAVCLETGGKHVGVVSGAMNTFGNLGGALSPVVIGYREEWFHGSWDAPLYSIAVMYLVSTVCWIFIDPTKPIPEKIYQQSEPREA